MLRPRRFKYKGNRRVRIARLLDETPFFEDYSCHEIERIVVADHGVYARTSMTTIMAIVDFCFKNRHVIRRATSWMEVVLNARPHSAMKLASVEDLAVNLFQEMKALVSKEEAKLITPHIPLSRAVH